jgi:uncharacterized protein (UPF0212 family)
MAERLNDYHVILTRSTIVAAHDEEEALQIAMEQVMYQYPEDSNASIEVEYLGPTQ